MKIVIIGNGPAGVTAAETVRGIDQQCEIVMISKEDVPFYSPCPLAEYLEGSVPRERLFLRSSEFYDRYRISRLFGSPAVWVDTKARRVLLGGDRTGESVDYDRLLIAAGARAVMPPIPGLADTPGVYALKTLADADDILARLDRTRRAVVIGSGFIGLEAAQGLVRRGVHVTVIEALGQVLPHMLDAELAAPVERRLIAHGIDVLLYSPAEAVIGGKDGVTAVRAGGREIPCGLVVCAAGVRADLSLVEGSDLATGRGIIVDDRMRTSQPDVFAAGDAIEMADAEGRHRVLPNWPNAVTTGRVAGFNMMGVDRRHPGLDVINVVRIFDVPTASFGAPTGERIVRWDSEGVIRKIALTKGRIVGLQMLGDVNGTGMYHELMKKGRDVEEFADVLAAPYFGYGRVLRPARLPATAEELQQA